jgi:hypothetical protein
MGSCSQQLTLVRATVQDCCAAATEGSAAVFGFQPDLAEEEKRGGEGVEAQLALPAPDVFPPLHLLQVSAFKVIVYRRFSRCA